MDNRPKIIIHSDYKIEITWPNDNELRFLYPFPSSQDYYGYISRKDYVYINDVIIPEVVKKYKIYEKKECSYCDRPFGDSLDRIVFQMPVVGKYIPFDYSEDAGPICVICDFCHHRRFKGGCDNIPEDIRESYMKRSKECKEKLSRTKEELKSE